MNQPVYVGQNLKRWRYIEILIDWKRGVVIQIVDQFISLRPNSSHRVIHGYFMHVVTGENCFVSIIRRF